MSVAMLLRVSLLMATCAVWVIAEAQEDEVIPDWLFANSGEDDEETTNIISTRKPKPGWVKGGTSCLNTDECGRGKCCLRRYKSPRRRCRRFQRIGEQCTEEQMMGGYYYGHCPCNKNGVCTYTGDRLRCVPKKEEKPPAPEVPSPQVPSPHPALPPRERPGQKPDSQESEETTGKPGGQPNPIDDATGNELPELPFESLRGPGVGSNAVPPLMPQSGGSSIPGSRNTPAVAVPPDSSPNSVGEPTASTNAGGRFGQEVNRLPTTVTRPHNGGTHPVSGPSTSAQGAAMPSSLPSPASPGNVPPQFGGSQNSRPPPSIEGGSSGLPRPTGQTVRPPGLPPSPPLPPGAEQKPSQYPSPPPPATSDNGLPPIVDERGPPPPLPPSPLDVMNGLRVQE